VQRYKNVFARKMTTMQHVKTEVSHKNGVPSLVLPMPSKGVCHLPLYAGRTVNEFTVDVRSEDRQDSEIYVTDLNGIRVALATPLEDLLRSPFLLNIDGTAYLIDASAKPVPLPENILGTPEVHDLTVKSYFREIKKKLVGYQHRYIPLQKYLKWCDDIGITETQAHDLLRAMHFSGDVLHFRDSPELRGFIFLKPEKVSETLVKELGIVFSTRDVPQLVQQLQAILPEYTPLNNKKLELDARAEKAAKFWMHVGLGYLVLQFGILARMVWWDFNWDIMEPISYFVSFATIMLGFVFFVMYREEYTYKALQDRQRKTALRKLYINEEFNWREWNDLHLKVEGLKELIGPQHLPKESKL